MELTILVKSCVLPTTTVRECRLCLTAVFLCKEGTAHKCMTCTVCVKYTVIPGACTHVLYQSDSGCVGVFRVFSALYVYA